MKRIGGVWGLRQWYWVGHPFDNVRGGRGGVLSQKGKTVPRGSIAVAPLKKKGGM